MKRRQFTTSVVALAGLSASSRLAALVAFSSSNDNGSIDGNPMARRRFEALLGQQFATTGSAETRLRLDAVNSAIRGHEQEQFHVSFSAPAGQSLPEGIYLLKGNGKPELGLHLIPGEFIDGRQQMLATVNLQQSA